MLWTVRREFQNRETHHICRIGMSLVCTYGNRHTAATRILEAGLSHSLVGEILGWSTSTTIMMIREVYGHISPKAKSQGMSDFAKNMEEQRKVVREEDVEGPQIGAH